MRTPSLSVLVAVTTSSRTKRAGTAASGCVVMLDLFALTLPTSFQLLPSGLTFSLKSRVFSLALSPPAPACFTTSFDRATLPPRSTCHQRPGPCEHHLSLVLLPRLPACLIKNPVTGNSRPRSTCNHFAGAAEHHLLALVSKLPSTAFSGPYSGPHGAE